MFVISQFCNKEKKGRKVVDKSWHACDLYFKQLRLLSLFLCSLCGRWPLCKQLLGKTNGSLNRCKELWQLDPTGGPRREGTADKVCQQTLTGLYHNELSVLEELRGWPANRPPQGAHIPTGQGSGLHVCVYMYMRAEGHLACLCSSRFGEPEKKLQFSHFFPLLAHSPPPVSTPSDNFVFSDLQWVWEKSSVCTCNCDDCLFTLYLNCAIHHRQKPTSGFEGVKQETRTVGYFCRVLFNRGGTLSFCGMGESLLLKDRAGN